ncbi:MAG: caspase family protein [Micromonosporaceae bacterium]|nr:caspase family protein [Micromonosporaceae bacterium]
MGKFRALLLGVAEYESSTVTGLPFVADDIRSLGATLESIGYLVKPVASGRLSKPKIIGEVTEFLHQAGRGDTLLVYLSGHGVHTAGRDYLVPSEVDLRVPRLHETLVAIDTWADEIENTAAGSVLFLIDACREGFDQRTKSMPRRWSEGDIRRVAGHHVAYVFACGPGQVARFVSDGGAGFSLFSRAVQQSLTDGLYGQHLEAFADAVRQAMDRIRVEFNLPAQDLRVSGETDSRFLVVVPCGPGAQPVAGTSWRQHVDDHEVWARTVPCELTERTRRGCAAVVDHLSRLRAEAGRRLGKDPWIDPGFAHRMSERIRFLVHQFLPEPVGEDADQRRISAGEAALLVVTPFVYDTFGAAMTARWSHVAPHAWNLGDRVGTDADDFWRFTEQYGRLCRRVAAAQDRETAAAGIGWWLLHQWVRRKALKDPLNLLSELLEPVSDDPVLGAVLRADLVSELLQTMSAAPGFLMRTDRPYALSSSRTLDEGSVREQQIRERLVAYLLAVGHAMAIEPVMLPDVVVEHLGVGDPVGLDALREAVAAAGWQPHGPIRVLSASCPHPAVDLALHGQADLLDRLLTEIQRSAARDSALAPLRTLPHRAAADKVGSVVDANGHPAYQSAGIRFRLSDDRVQELLMGEQLYGDRSLAIRELYQNALDACRYRRARQQFLQDSTGGSSPWTGRITFAQGVDEHGRAYIECRDNGVGMGERELAEVFSRTGVRFTELPEFLEEEAVWRRRNPPIRLYPNSRFGIGVLSYFMLADEIRVRTCRFGRDGRPGDQLTVVIAGPGNLFRIGKDGASGEPGTEVRLYLRAGAAAPSCVDILRRLLWVAEFDTTAEDGREHQSWTPGALSEAAPIGTANPHDDDAEPAQALVRGVPGGSVWWCHAAGAFLVDGVWVQQGHHGAVVNLTGEFAPRLSVDRKQILHLRPEHVLQLLREAIPAVTASDSPVLTFDWLSRLVVGAPRIADEILDAAIQEGRRGWTRQPDDDSLIVAGCFPPDQETDWLPPAAWSPVPPNRREALYGGLPTHGGIPLWRATAWAATHAVTPAIPSTIDVTSIRRAYPSDAILLDPEPSAVALAERRRTRWVGDGSYEGLDRTRPVSVGHLVAASARLERGIREVAERLIALGYRIAADPDALPARAVTPVDAALVRSKLAARQPPLDPLEPVPAGWVIRASADVGCGLREAASRLSDLGYHLMSDPDTLPVWPAAPNDATLVSRYLDADAPWLDPQELVPTRHVIGASEVLGRGVRETADRLVALGYRLAADPSTLPVSPAPITDAMLISLSLNPRNPWRDQLPWLDLPPGWDGDCGRSRSGWSCWATALRRNPERYPPGRPPSTTPGLSAGTPACRTHG